jgi:hypothetical protein
MIVKMQDGITPKGNNKRVRKLQSKKTQISLVTLDALILFWLLCFAYVYLGVYLGYGMP